MRGHASKPSSGIATLVLEDREIALRWRVNRRAKRILLHADSGSGDIELVLPSLRARTAGLRFAADKKDWIQAHLDATPVRVPFADDAEIPILDESHRIRHIPALPPSVQRLDGELRIGGETGTINTRMESWLRQEARAIITPRAHALAARLDRSICRITIRDPRTRWASCSSTGGLNFSWRLILAPEYVLDYVITHEAAHLVELNHSHRFWALVRQLYPDPEPACRWLRVHGPALHRYG